MQASSTLKTIFLIIILFLSVFNISYSQVNITPNQTAQVLAQKLAGPGIIITNPTLTCPSLANGLFTVTGSNLGLDSGILLTTGHAANASGNASYLASTNNGAAGDAQLGALVGATTYDACELQFDVTPQGDSIKFDYVFGSEEYTNSVCAQYNDVFAFFISGPGITGTQNMALVPGTNVPVAVNSINSGVPGSYSNGTLSVCNAMGPGSPFTQYYVDNAGGTTITYRGFTTVLTAQHDVTPCSVYHLKLAIADVVNGLYDSGVFIAAGSLKTNTYHFDTSLAIGNIINGIDHSIVKGCSPATITIKGTPSGTDQTLKLILAGSATNGYDYAQLADSVIMPANDSVVSFNVQGIPTPLNGGKTVKIYLLSPYSCVGIIDSVELNILDSIHATILTPDTSLCLGTSLQILTDGTSGLTYQWTPTGSLNNPTISEPIATPTSTTIYTMVATLPNSGCSAITRTVKLTINTVTATILTADTTVCLGQSVQIMVAGNDSFSYQWSPAATLNNANIKDPIATPVTGINNYTLTVTAPPQSGCGYTTLNYSITAVSPVISIGTYDTSICKGGSSQINVIGDNNFSYSWQPSASLNNANIMSPVASPTATTTYTVVTTVPGLAGCSDMETATIKVTNITLNAENESVCNNMPAQLSVMAIPADSSYSYLWSGPNGYTSTLQNPVLPVLNQHNSGTYQVVVSGNGCSDSTQVAVNAVTPVQPVVISPLSVCLNSQPAALTATGQNLVWYTSRGDSIGSTVAPAPPTNEAGEYVYFVAEQDGNCFSDKSKIDVLVASCCNDPVFLPTAFSPNGDGMNDVFTVNKHPEYIILEFNVYNRWGQLVFQGNNSNYKWDGFFNGQPCETGTYNYMLNISCNSQNGTLLHYKGVVTLVR